MAETKQVTFKHTEVVEALLRQQDIHEGIWGIYLEFGIQGANINTGPEDNILPAAIIPVLKIGLQRFDKESNIAVDASKVNPKSKLASR